MNRRHIVKVLNVASELEATEVAKKMVRLGPATAAEVLADYARLKEIDDEAIAESRRQFEAGEIAEEDIYTGDFLLQGGGYPLRYESKLRDRKVGAFMPVTVQTLEDFKGGDFIRFMDERARDLIQKEAVRYLDSLTAV